MIDPESMTDKARRRLLAERVLGFINGKRKYGYVVLGKGVALLRAGDFAKTSDGAIVHPVYVTADGYVGVQEFIGHGEHVRVLVSEWRPEQLVLA